MPQSHTSSESIAALILAGGRSSRMGSDKALLPLDGQPLLYRTCEIAQRCCAKVYVITPRSLEYQRYLPPGCCLIQETALPHELLPHGALVGFAQGLQQIDSDWILLLACDLPNLQPGVLQRWCAETTMLKNSVMAIVPRTDKGWEPLCGLYRRDCLPNLQQFIAQEGRSFQRWLDSLSVHPIALSDPAMLFNCNTPEDWEHILKQRQPHL